MTDYYRSMEHSKYSLYIIGKDLLFHHHFFLIRNFNILFRILFIFFRIGWDLFVCIFQNMFLKVFLHGIIDNITYDLYIIYSSLLSIQNRQFTIL
jgi:hypothetical protein